MHMGVQACFAGREQEHSYFMLEPNQGNDKYEESRQGEEKIVLTHERLAF